MNCKIKTTGSPFIDWCCEHITFNLKDLDYDTLGEFNMVCDMLTNAIDGLGNITACKYPRSLFYNLLNLKDKITDGEVILGYMLHSYKNEISYYLPQVAIVIGDEIHQVLVTTLQEFCEKEYPNKSYAYYIEYDYEEIDLS